ncbi:MAG: hypothetical protein HYR56_28975 [Acidobacteria bacterium]|nr:hypothetical protein [Acidobacteriota bacterium]MBI3422751.1 hypothetical protein [Acidobacteriota bacterium]
MHKLVLTCVTIGYLTICGSIGLAQQPAPTPTPSNIRQFKCGKIITTYNKDTDETTVQLFPRLIYGTINTGVGRFLTSEPPRPTRQFGEPPISDEPQRGLMLQTFFTYHGKTPRAPDKVALLFTSQDTAPRYNVGRRVIFEIDGEKLDIGDAEIIQSRAENYGVGEKQPDSYSYHKELLGISMPFETFLRLGQAKKLKLKLHTTEIPYNACNIEALRNLASQTTK